jgi:uncharacterized protein YndB with AHSA1/START domain
MYSNLEVALEFSAVEAAETETVVPATPEETWEAITNPEHLGEWFDDDAEVDLRPGGELTIGDRSGFVEEVAEPTRFVFWWSADDEESSRVEIELEPAVAGTRVRVTETRPLSALPSFAAGPQLSAVA